MELNYDENGRATQPARYRPRVLAVRNGECPPAILVAAACASRVAKVMIERMVIDLGSGQRRFRYQGVGILLTD